MKALALRSKQRTWRLFLFCFLFMAAALIVTIADAAPAPHSAPAVRDFWVWNLNSMPPGFRRARATLRASGERTMIYVEDKYYGTRITPEFVNRLEYQLETATPASALVTETGIVPLEERLFGSLPRKITNDERLIVLFADLGQYQNTQSDGFFNSYDQLTDADAMAKFRQHSNEANVIYVNGFRHSEAYTTGVVAHELQHLLASTSTEKPRESWLAESLAEGAMLLTGFFGDQGHVEKFLANTGKYPLVTPSYVQHGPQLLFSSFLIDSLPLSNGTAIGVVSSIPKTGRDAVEEAFLRLTDVPLSFDAIFSNFVSYVFTQAEGAISLPSSWRHNPGIRVPPVAPYFTYKAGSGTLSGSLAPYSFVAIDLAQELSPSATIQVERAADKDATGCAASASVLWKPVSKTRLAIYAVGCDPGEKPETVQFRLKILDQPSLMPAGPFKILR